MNPGACFIGYRFFISPRMNPGACMLDAFGQGEEFPEAEAVEYRLIFYCSSLNGFF
jgi:hypothetical protein